MRWSIQIFEYGDRYHAWETFHIDFCRNIYCVQYMPYIRIRKFECWNSLASHTKSNRFTQFWSSIFEQTTNYCLKYWNRLVNHHHYCNYAYSNTTHTCNAFFIVLIIHWNKPLFVFILTAVSCINVKIEIIHSNNCSNHIQLVHAISSCTESPSYKCTFIYSSIIRTILVANKYAYYERSMHNQNLSGPSN